MIQAAKAKDERDKMVRQMMETLSSTLRMMGCHLKIFVVCMHEIGDVGDVKSTNWISAEPTEDELYQAVNAIVNRQAAEEISAGHKVQ